MCGITGFLDPKHATARDAIATVRAMATTLAHRGPDDSGEWIDVKHGVSFAHRRLSVIDLSTTGHQPMVSASGRFVIVFNGEIYNHHEIRNHICASTSVKWHGTSDTETMLESFEVFGFHNTLVMAVGMFALAVWDRDKLILHLARDRIGEKPLYYGWQNELFLFGSELKAIRRHPKFTAEVDRQALHALLRHNCIPAPMTIYVGIRKLEPGSYLTLDSRSSNVSIDKYWDKYSVWKQKCQNAFNGNLQEAVDIAHEKLSQSVRQQMVADVPLGAFLSGGVDSSTIVALMQSNTQRAVKTFTIGFADSQYDEAPFAREIAQHLGTDHTELYVSVDEALGMIEKLPTVYDEPFSDSSQLPTMLVSQLARQEVTVSLSGDGGDELFGGYRRYYATQKAWPTIQAIPNVLRKSIVWLLSNIPNRVYSAIGKIAGQRFSQPAEKFRKIAEGLSAHTIVELYSKFITHWESPSDAIIESPNYDAKHHLQRWLEEGADDAMMLADLSWYLPDDVLVKVDRAAMFCSLETRVPILDHRVVEFAWTLPTSMKVDSHGTKPILRGILNKYIPKKMFERPKMGFAVPIDRWLRGSLRNWAEALLLPSRLKSQGFFREDIVHKMWTEHLSGQRDWQYHLWDILMFQQWYEHSRD
jgi:asparagine synthase (glutamine-hydrolysing)